MQRTITLNDPRNKSYRKCLKIMAEEPLLWEAVRVAVQVWAPAAALVSAPVWALLLAEPLLAQALVPVLVSVLEREEEQTERFPVRLVQEASATPLSSHIHLRGRASSWLPCRHRRSRQTRSS